MATGNTVNIQKLVDNAAIPGHAYIIEIYTSEPMKNIAVGNISCLSNETPVLKTISDNNTLYVYHLSGAQTSSANSGDMCAIPITGKDYADNNINAFTTATSYTINVRQNNNPLTTSNNPDTYHELFFNCGGGRTSGSGSCLIAGFSMSKQTVNPGCSVDFTDESFPEPDTWFWEFGDGSSSFTQYPTHSYGLPGTYTVKLTVTRNGTTDSEEKSITVTTGFVVDFVADKTVVNEGESIQFTDLSSACNTTSWHWDFGDGETSTSSNPTHSYKQPGIYTVTLTINGITTTQKIDYIAVNEIPGLHLNCPSDITTQINKNVNVTVSFIGGQPPYRLDAFFSNLNEQSVDNINSTNYTFQLVYNDTYNNTVNYATVNITDANGITDFCSFKIIVGTPCEGTNIPTAVIDSYSDGETIEMCLDQTLEFTTTNTNVITWQSKVSGCNFFCDGHTDNSASYSFSPDKAKKYQLRLTKINSCGLAVTTLFINVNNCVDKIGSGVSSSSSIILENMSFQIDFEAWELPGENKCQPVQPTKFRTSLWQKDIFGIYELVKIKCGSNDKLAKIKIEDVDPYTNSFIGGSHFYGLYNAEFGIDAKILSYKNKYKIMFEVWDENNFNKNSWVKGTSEIKECATGLGVELGDNDAKQAVKNVYDAYQRIFTKKPCFHEANFYEFKVVKCRKFERDKTIKDRLFRGRRTIVGNVITAAGCDGCNVIIKNTANVDFIGQTRVHLKPGFRADEDSKFHAWIEPSCNSSDKRETRDTILPEIIPAISDTIIAYDDDVIYSKTEDENDSIPLNVTVPVLKLYPNPTKSVLNIEVINVPEQSTLSIFNTLGIELKNFGVISGTNRYEFIFKEQPDGVYFIKLIKDNMVINKRVVFMR